MAVFTSISAIIGLTSVITGMGVAAGTAAVVGGMIVGAVIGSVVGGVVAACTGGNILKGMLTGGLVGAALPLAGSVLGVTGSGTIGSATAPVNVFTGVGPTTVGGGPVSGGTSTGVLASDAGYTFAPEVVGAGGGGTAGGGGAGAGGAATGLTKGQEAALTVGLSGVGSAAEALGKKGSEEDKARYEAERDARLAAARAGELQITPSSPKSTAGIFKRTDDATAANKESTTVNKEATAGQAVNQSTVVPSAMDYRMNPPPQPQLNLAGAKP